MGMNHLICKSLCVQLWVSGYRTLLHWNALNQVGIQTHNGIVLSPLLHLHVLHFIRGLYCIVSKRYNAIAPHSQTIARNTDMNPDLGLITKHPYLRMHVLFSPTQCVQLIVAILVLLWMALSTTLVLAGTPKLWLCVTQDWHCLELLWLCVVMEGPGSQTQLTSNAYSTPQLVRTCQQRSHACENKDTTAHKMVP